LPSPYKNKIIHNLFCLFNNECVNLQSLLNKRIVMIVINIKENEPIDKALKRFKKKFEKTGVLKALRARSYYEKKSVRLRKEVIRASYRLKLQEAASND